MIRMIPMAHLARSRNHSVTNKKPVALVAPPVLGGAARARCLADVKTAAT